MELKQINEQNSMNRRHGRSHASREDALTTIIEREREMYDTCGIGENDEIEWIPVFVFYLLLS